MYNIIYNCVELYRKCTVVLNTQLYVNLNINNIIDTLIYSVELCMKAVESAWLQVSYFLNYIIP